MVQAYDSDWTSEGRTVEPLRPFEVEVLRSVSKLNAPSRLVSLG
jgi:hypothetical protein